MLRIVLLLLIVFPATSLGQKSKPLSGYLIYVLGKDTTMAGYYELNGNQFNMEVLAKPNVSVTKMKGYTEMYLTGSREIFQTW